jgi:hypothetical protein
MRRIDDNILDKLISTRTTWYVLRNEKIYTKSFQKHIATSRNSIISSIHIYRNRKGVQKQSMEKEQVKEGVDL